MRTSCIHYNWGGGDGRPTYPKQYGARCEHFKSFFIGNAQIVENNAFITKPKIRIIHIRTTTGSTPTRRIEFEIICAGCKHYKYKRRKDERKGSEKITKDSKCFM